MYAPPEYKCIDEPGGTPGRLCVRFVLSGLRIMAITWWRNGDRERGAT